MDNSVFTAIVSIFSTVIGAFLGWFLSYMTENLNNKVRLCFSLQPYNQDDTIESELRTKYSDSGYAIFVYNTGKTPYILSEFQLNTKKTIITECVLTEAVTIMPYESYIYELNDQDYDSIRFHCGEQNISDCTIFAYDVGEKRCKAKLDLFLPKMQSDFRKDIK
ncbi:hypothetical protein [Hungatella hathewayi]|uniref:hypothetical protein n=1 Tax=Hungatella hathewayi TaxID=154046 RepID=UPI0035675BF7